MKEQVFVKTEAVNLKKQYISYEASGELQLELVKIAVINIGLVKLSPWEWLKVGRWTAK